MTRFADAVESLLQIALAWVGILVLVGEEVGNLALWCLLAIIYLIMRSVRSNGSSGRGYRNQRSFVGCAWGSRFWPAWSG